MKRFGTSVGSRNQAPPEGWNDILPTIEEFELKMRDGKYLFRQRLFSKDLIFS